MFPPRPTILPLATLFALSGSGPEEPLANGNSRHLAISLSELLEATRFGVIRLDGTEPIIEAGERAWEVTGRAATGCLVA